MRFEIAARSIRGGRSYQEDTWSLHALNGDDLTSAADSPNGVVMPTGGLVVVADGMGGEGGGAQASRLVADRFSEAFFAEACAGLPPEERLRGALDEANKGLLAAKQRRGDLKEKSGSTLIAGLVRDGGLHFLSVGDSSIWRCRDDEIHRVNILHERAPEMDVRAAELDTEDAWDIVLNDTQRNSITAAVMGLPLEAQHSQVALRPILPGDVLIFASDGIETLTAEHLRRSAATILAKRNAAALAQALVRMVERIGTRDQDNTTVVVVHALADSGRTQILPGSESRRAGAPPPVPRPEAPAETVEKTAAGSRRPTPSSGRSIAVVATVAALAAVVLVVAVYAAYGPALWTGEAPLATNAQRGATPPIGPTPSNPASGPASPTNAASSGPPARPLDGAAPAATGANPQGASLEQSPTAGGGPAPAVAREGAPEQQSGAGSPVAAAGSRVPKAGKTTKKSETGGPPAAEPAKGAPDDGGAREGQPR